MQRRPDRILPLGRQLYEARQRAQLKAKQLARMAGVSAAAVYNIERADRGGRTRTLVELATALGLTLRIPDLAALIRDRQMSIAELAEAAGVAFDTVGGLVAKPLSGNIRSLEAVCAALGCPPKLIV